MVHFAGWEMPLHYGSQIDEHHCVRTAAGMFDVSHMSVVDISGAARERFCDFSLPMMSVFCESRARRCTAAC